MVKATSRAGRWALFSHREEVPEASEARRVMPMETKLRYPSGSVIVTHTARPTWVSSGLAPRGHSDPLQHQLP